MKTKTNDNPRSTELVARDFACPDCHERRMDRLAWQADGERVTCITCRKVYKPLTK